MLHCFNCTSSSWLSFLSTFFIWFLPPNASFRLLYLVCSPQPNLLHENNSPAGSLHQLINPLFPFITPPFLAQTLFFSTTLKMEAASCTTTSPHKLPYPTRHQSSSPMLPNVNSFLLTPVFCLHVQRKQLDTVAVILFLGMWNMQ